MEIEQTEKEMIIRIPKEKDYTIDELKQLVTNEIYKKTKDSDLPISDLLKIYVDIFK